MELVDLHEPILDIQEHKLMNGNCGSYAIALIEMFKSRYHCEFIIVYDEDDCLFHVGALIDDRIFDGRGFNSYDQFICCRYDEFRDQFTHVLGEYYVEDHDYDEYEIQYVKNNTGFYTKPKEFIKLLLDKA